MSRYRGPKLRIVRRLGSLPGLTTKSSNKTNRPGKPGNNNEKNLNSKVKLTEYGIRLEEKQKLKFNYGLTENKLFKYVKKARRKDGVTGLILLQLLEMRLDTICFTLGLAKSIAQARQLVNHGHILVNNKTVNISSFQCKLNDIIKIKKKNNNLIKDTKVINIPNHLKLTTLSGEAIILDYCERYNVPLELNELSVIEYYSRR
uniref:Ribosomal protein S4 n=1 Tax=Climaconeis cf. scalaris TaxID=2846828 RepID=A0A8F8SPE7_9STRA|nr:ribosomal protein S4 [Climaconeis cf. scalaris]QYB19182.1 ribosomal protein S4 [Climaconeis cf. scalaris]